jgi:hypothetical protein
LLSFTGTRHSHRRLTRRWATTHSTPAATGPAPIATGYRVLDTLPFGLKRLKAYLRERNVGRLTIKKRGTAVVPEQLRKQLVLTGTEEATIVLTRVAGAQTVLLVEPLRGGA